MATLEIDPLMIEILSRLPAESLLRFKSVCKSWYALINDPKFATEHFSNSLKHHNHVLLKRHAMKNSKTKEIMFSILKSPLSVDRSVSYLDVDLSLGEEYQKFEIYGHSHGLLCLSDRYEDIILCNPTTREFRKLPPSILFQTEPLNEQDDVVLSPATVGFGYDPKSRDFKVVRIVEFLKRASRFCYQRAEIYDLSKDRWREIYKPSCACAYRLPGCEMYHQGTYYWLAHDNVHEEIIESFDMSEEVFGLIRVPECFQFWMESRIWFRRLGVLNGSIVLFHHPMTNVNEIVFEVWKMEKDESSSSSGAVTWSKLLRICPAFEIGKPLLFVSSDELLMEAADKREVILYNIKTHRFKALPMKGHPETFFQAFFWHKCLISVKGGSNITYEF